MVVAKNRGPRSHSFLELTREGKGKEGSRGRPRCGAQLQCRRSTTDKRERTLDGTRAGCMGAACVLRIKKKHNKKDDNGKQLQANERR